MATAAQGPFVMVDTREEFDRLMVHPASLSGEYDPARREGRVLFPTMHAARNARREV